MSLHAQLYLTRSKAAWPSRQEIADAAGRHVEGGSNVGFRSLIGATVGLLVRSYVRFPYVHALMLRGTDISVARRRGSSKP